MGEAENSDKLASDRWQLLLETLYTLRDDQDMFSPVSLEPELLFELEFWCFHSFRLYIEAISCILYEEVRDILDLLYLLPVVDERFLEKKSWLETVFPLWWTDFDLFGRSGSFLEKSTPDFEVLCVFFGSGGSFGLQFFGSGCIISKW